MWVNCVTSSLQVYNVLFILPSQRFKVHGLVLRRVPSHSSCCWWLLLAKFCRICCWQCSCSISSLRFLWARDACANRRVRWCNSLFAARLMFNASHTVSLTTSSRVASLCTKVSMAIWNKMWKFVVRACFPLKRFVTPSSLVMIFLLTGIPNYPPYSITFITSQIRSTTMPNVYPHGVIWTYCI